MREITNNWTAANQEYLIKAIALVREALQHKIAQQTNEEVSFSESWEFPEMEEPPAIEKLCQIFSLSPFERDVLLLCAGMEFDGEWASLCAKVAGDPQRNYPTFSLALAVLPQAYWGAIAPNAPLRRWRLVEMGASNSLTACPLRIDERILHYLAGIDHLDDRLIGMVEEVAAEDIAVPSHQKLVEQLTQTWLQGSQRTGLLPVLQLCGSETGSKKAIASAACTQLGLNLHSISAEAIPTDNDRLNLVKCLWEREWQLSDRVLLVDCDALETPEAARESAVARLIESINCPLIVTSIDRRRQRQRLLVTFDVGQPIPEEQRAIWRSALGETAESFNGHIETLVSHFSLTSAEIYAACLKVNGEDNNFQQLWETCRDRARPRLDELAQRIEPSASWEDLILPEKEQQVLNDIVAHLRQRSKVYEYWGFIGKGKRGLGISALFAGASGTGKTMAAELLAQELKLDVYRIDLSSVVSKYIGETEKNLRRVFDAAEAGGVILLFDEADSLFGKRSEVKDSNDRYANMEVSYLLQRMESYRGLAILTTNLKGSIDQAFLRRIRFIVQFPFPDATQRAEIWRRVFPSQAPTEGLDFNKLGKLNVAGGNIRNIALNAAFIAADSGEPVQMKHILQSVKSEYIKMERSLTDVEVKGWV